MNALKSFPSPGDPPSEPPPEAAFDDTDSERIVIVVGPGPECAETVAQSFVVQGEPMRIVWFEQARQALASGLQKALAGVIVCHRAEQLPQSDIHRLREALPGTPVLAWELNAA
jgi:hypothetical protein